MNKLMRILGGAGAVFVAATLVWAPVGAANAAEFIGPDETGNTIVAAGGEHRNAYVAGGDVLINSDILGDLVVAGGDVTIEGSIEQDLIVVGGMIKVNGMVNGDVRIAGGEVELNNEVVGDVVGVGGKVKVAGPVGGDVVVMGGEASILQAVGGQLMIRAGMVHVDGPVAGPVDIVASEKLSIGSKAVFTDTAKYKSPQEAQIAEGAQVGDLQFEKMEVRSGSNAIEQALEGIFAITFVLKLLAMILAALILIKLFPKTSSELVHHLEANPWGNLGIGFVGAVSTPIIALILMVTFVGFYAGIIVLLLWMVWMMAGVLVGMVLVGSWINKKLTKKAELTVDWQGAVIGVVVLSLLAFIPVIGWLVMAFVILAGFGTIIRHLAAAILSQQLSVSTKQE
jgi:cytoskeletal protein CcmA (bactofilin family)